MVTKIEDINLPMSIVSRIIKDALPEGASCSKESRIALTKAASVFVFFLTSSCTEVAQDQNQKTLTANHVLTALKNTEFEGFITKLTEQLEDFRKINNTKKSKKKESMGGEEPEPEAEEDA